MIPSTTRCAHSIHNASGKFWRNVVSFILLTIFLLLNPAETFHAPVSTKDRSPLHTLHARKIDESFEFNTRKYVEFFEDMFSKKSIDAMVEEIVNPEKFEAKIARERLPRKYADSIVLNKIGLSGPFDLEKIEGDPSKLVLSWSSIPFRLALFGFFYAIFPAVQGSIRDFIEADNQALTNALCGAFLPTVSILFGTLTSFTISTLLEYQNTIKLDVNRETSAAVKLTKKLIALPTENNEITPEDKAMCLEYVWFYMKTLAERSRKEEMYFMLYEDPLLKIMDILNTVPDSALLERAFIQLDAVLDARQNRLTVEGEGIPYVQLNLLLSLGFVVILGFLVLSDNKQIYQDVQSQRDIRVFFALLLSGVTLTYEFIKDLNRPFKGKLNLGKRTLTGVNLLQIKNFLYQEMGEAWIRQTNAKLGRKRADLYSVTAKK
mmetsp:Transcript_651/g.1012  ORF Transcript_651/g.1012 Transcript_651/m.1012 type:complete len:434 (+) Transcript_651:95-1396(+)